MASQPTCGKGLAEHSVLPAKMGEWTAAVAENLELHTEALDLTDESSRRERDAYAFERFVSLEQDLLTLLQKRVEQDRRMLSAMGGRS